MEEIIGEMSFPCSTGNPMVDILLGNKLGIAKGNGVDVHCSLTLPYPCPVHDIDFCIILSNALDNAICACNKVQEQEAFKNVEQYKRVTGDIQGDFILIEIENSFEGRVFEEGTGLSNIRKIAEKYQEAANIKSDNKINGVIRNYNNIICA
ncbi:MAG: GHKL domain-containing protein [Lachnospiraceae bacterium]|nr:GHKL domain-containing protein [Lachnospiraceae bacterium]MDE7205088.1 GHKL domain-containing protein [Lachnospiraceae bacterium]